MCRRDSAGGSGDDPYCSSDDRRCSTAGPSETRVGASAVASGPGGVAVRTNTCFFSRAPRTPLQTQTQAQVDGKDFRLMFVWPFLAKAGDDIPGLVQQGSYGQLLGYIRGRLDQ